MTTRTRYLWLNSTVAFALAWMLITTLHEAAHAAAGLVLGHSVTLYPYEVTFPSGRPESDQIVTAAAGPVFSLVLGLLLIGAGRSWGSGFWRLLVLWLGFLSAQNFFGYLFIAPLAKAGDTGRVLSLLGVPAWVFIASAVLGYAGILLLARLFAGQLVRYARSPAELRQIAIFSWLAGTAIAVIITLLEIRQRDLPGDVTVIVLAAAVAAGIFAPQMSFFYRRCRASSEVLRLGVPILGIIATLAVAAFLILYLASGVTIG